MAEKRCVTYLADYWLYFKEMLVKIKGEGFLSGTDIKKPSN